MHYLPALVSVPLARKREEKREGWEEGKTWRRMRVFLGGFDGKMKEKWRREGGFLRALEEKR